MAYAFISGIPAAGKSYLAGKVASKMGVQHVGIDDWRKEMRQDPTFRKWVDFFFDLNEEEYWRTTSCDDRWHNLRQQAEAFWPTILKKVRQVQASEKGAIFEGVNFLPYLARKDLEFEGIFLTGESFDVIFERNQRAPRWGATPELQRKEAESFWNCERMKYAEEAGKFGYKVFSDPMLAEQELLIMLKEEK